MIHLLTTFAFISFFLLQPHLAFATPATKRVSTLQEAKSEKARLDAKTRKDKEKKKGGIILQSGEDGYFVIDNAAAKQSAVIWNLLKDIRDDEPIPLEGLTNERLKNIVSILSGMAKNKDVREKRQYLKKELHNKGVKYLNQLLADANFLDIDVLSEVAAHIFSEHVFNKDLEQVAKMTPAQYEIYVNENFHSLPTLVQTTVISQALPGVERLAPANVKKDRKQLGAGRLDLVSAQIIVYLTRHHTYLDHLPASLNSAFQKLSEDRHQLLAKMFTAPLEPSEFAVWSRHCSLPSYPDYNMYSDSTPDARYHDNQDGTITDLCTSLIWEKKPSATKVNFAQAKKNCDKLEKAGFTDWRAPTSVELQTLVDYQAKDPALNRVFAKGLGKFWSATVSTGDITRAWSVDFRDGTVILDDDSDLDHQVRCVRAGGFSFPREGERYTIEKDKGIVVDNFTDLEWQLVQTHAAADFANNGQKSCDALVLGGHDDWRLPHVKELSTIVDLTADMNANDQSASINERVFPDTPPVYHWTSTLEVPMRQHVWTVSFLEGIVSVETDYNMAYRCVR